MNSLESMAAAAPPYEGGGRWSRFIRVYFDQMKAKKYTIQGYAEWCFQQGLIAENDRRKLADALRMHKCRKKKK